MIIHMKRQAGFTAIEIVITLVVMAILMTLAVVSLSGSQARARDDERASNAGTIARHLDSLYSSNREFTNPPSGPVFAIRGSYPASNMLSNETARASLFKDLPATILIDPSKDTSAQTITVATNANESTSGVTPQPSLASGGYPVVYQPLTRNNTLCTVYTAVEANRCVRFNLYYFQEATSSVQMIRSQYR